ncbi:MAG: thioredoxin domain-containing protein [Archangium sp.]|nr:thioredoxin domain-containing protein [Archangium sp.]
MRFFLIGAVFLSACATTQSAQQGEGPTPVVAKYGERVIRLAEVDAKVADELSKLQEQMYELRSEAADRIAIEALVAQKAKAAGQSEEGWLAKNIESGLEEPSEAEMRALFEKARGRLPPEVTFDDVKPEIRKAVQREERTRRAREVFGQLKKEAGFVMVLEGPVKPRKSVDATGPSRGNAAAKVVIVEFADFECHFCAKAHETVMLVLKAYGDKVRLVFRHYPLSFHPKAPKAAEATACADEQGRFWELHDALFESQELDVDALKMQAKQAGVDETKFASCLDSGRTAALVKRDVAAGQQVGVSGTPAFFINGFMLSGAQPEEAFRKVIDAELARLGAD